LLSIINSRDIASIRALRGVGVKKAEGIVGALDMDGAGLQVESLEQLSGLKGVGTRTVYNMRMGLFV